MREELNELKTKFYVKIANQVSSLFATGISQQPQASAPRAAADATDRASKVELKEKCENDKFLQKNIKICLKSLIEERYIGKVNLEKNKPL